LLTASAVCAALSKMHEASSMTMPALIMRVDALPQKWQEIVAKGFERDTKYDYFTVFEWESDKEAIAKLHKRVSDVETALKTYGGTVHAHVTRFPVGVSVQSAVDAASGGGGHVRFQGFGGSGGGGGASFGSTGWSEQKE
jgi:uncharacterized membrane protein YgcG